MSIRAFLSGGERPVMVIGAAHDGDAASGPLSLRDAGLVRRLESRGAKVVDAGDIVAGRGLTPACRLLRDTVRTAIIKGARPLVLGDGATARTGTHAGAAAAARALGSTAPGMLRITSRAGLSEGSGESIQALLGVGHFTVDPSVDPHDALDPERVVLVGTDPLNDAERALAEAAGVRVIEREEIRRRGIDAVIAEALVHVAGRDGRFTLSLALDGLGGQDEAHPERISIDDIRIAVDMIAERGELLALELLDIDPASEGSERCARLAVDAAATLLTSWTDETPVIQRAAAS